MQLIYHFCGEKNECEKENSIHKKDFDIVTGISDLKNVNLHHIQDDRARCAVRCDAIIMTSYVFVVVVSFCF